MIQFDKAKEILNHVYGSDIAQAGFSSKHSRDDEFLVIPGQYGPRWIVPSLPQWGSKVLGQWRPYSFTSKIKWKGLLLAYAVGVLGKVPGIDCVPINSENTLQIKGIELPLVPVLYLGTPGPQQKIVATLVSPNNGEPQVIMKVALSEVSWMSLQHEVKNLEKLALANVPGVPAFLSLDGDKKRTFQSVVKGRLTSRKLTRKHIVWLLCLPKSGQKTSVNEQKEQLLEYSESDKNILPKQQRQIFSSALKVIKGKSRFPNVLAHGDFTPWNLKWETDGSLAAIDWEDAEDNGLPLLDLCHFFFMQAYLFKEKTPIKKLYSNTLVHGYLSELEIDIKSLPSLAVLYILRTAIRENTISEGYRDFLFHELRNLGDVPKWLTI